MEADTLRSSIARIDSMLLQYIKEVREGQRENSIISGSSFATKPEDVWELLRRELEDVGISGELMYKNREYIIQYLATAVNNGEMGQQYEVASILEFDQGDSGDGMLHNEISVQKSEALAANSNPETQSIQPIISNISSKDESCSELDKNSTRLSNRSSPRVVNLPQKLVVESELKATATKAIGNEFDTPISSVGQHSEQIHHYQPIDTNGTPDAGVAPLFFLFHGRPVPYSNAASLLYRSAARWLSYQQAWILLMGDMVGFNRVKYSYIL